MRFRALFLLRAGTLVGTVAEDDRGNRLAVIVRFHNPARTFELKRAVFSLVCQSHRPLTICIVTQRFTERQTEKLREDLAPTLSLDPGIKLQIENFDQESPLDARSALITLGMKRTVERYFSLLDHDDIILGNGYSGLIKELSRSKTSIAFGSIAAKYADIFHDVIMVEHRREVFTGENLFDLFQGNFCPIHSFVIDRQGVDPDELFFDATISKGEDYEFLLRFCSKYIASFESLGTFVGDYYLKNDDSNTIGVEAMVTSAGWADWERCLKFIEERKTDLFLSPAVQQVLGLSPVDPSLTIKGFLDTANSAKSRTEIAEHVQDEMRRT